MKFQGQLLEIWTFPKKKLVKSPNLEANAKNQRPRFSPIQNTRQIDINWNKSSNWGRNRPKIHQNWWKPSKFWNSKLNRIKKNSAELENSRKLGEESPNLERLRNLKLVDFGVDFAVGVDWRRQLKSEEKWTIIRSTPMKRCGWGCGWGDRLSLHPVLIRRGITLPLPLKSCSMEEEAAAAVVVLVVEERRKRAEIGKRNSKGRPECIHHLVRNSPVLEHC